EVHERDSADVCAAQRASAAAPATTLSNGSWLRAFVCHLRPGWRSSPAQYHIQGELKRSLPRPTPRTDLLASRTRMRADGEPAPRPRLRYGQKPFLAFRVPNNAIDPFYQPRNTAAS